MESVREEEGEVEVYSEESESDENELEGGETVEEENTEVHDDIRDLENALLQPEAGASNTTDAQTISIPMQPTSNTDLSVPCDDPSTLKFDDLEISDLSDKELSRSPPQSRRKLSFGEDRPEEDEEEATKQKGDIKSIVAADMTKRRAQQQRKYHSKRSVRSAGRSQGSKAKQDKRVKLSDHKGVWE